MSKIGLIVKREYLTRVRKRSFIVLTLLGPLLISAMWAIPLYLAMQEGADQTVQVIDDSKILDRSNNRIGNISLEFTDQELDSLKTGVRDGYLDAILYIPEIDLENPRGIVLYSESSMGMETVSSLENTVERRIEELKLERSGLNKEILDEIKTNISLSTINLTEQGEEESNTRVSVIIGYFFTFMIYMFIFIYGVQVMRGVIEEKSNKIIEVIISSVKPFELMMGKIIGVAAVVLTQIGLWIVLSFAISTVIFQATGISREQPQIAQSLETEQDVEMNSRMENMMEGLGEMNYVTIVGSFIFFFLGGYLLYAALFAAVGAAVGSDSDSQQMVFPITMPLIFAIMVVNVVVRNPDSSLAFWTSIIPFTSPIVMMMRVPFGVPAWQLILSMVLLIGGFIFCTWVAARIYRVGILIHGSKVNYRTLVKWFLSND